MNRAAYGLLLALTSVACAATPAPRIAVASTAPSPAPPPPPRWQAIVTPAVTSWLTRAGDEPDGAIDLLAYGLRLRARGRDVQWATDGTLQPIVAHAQDGAQWLFATEDGAMFRASSFVGPLTYAGETGGVPLTAGFDSRGNLAARANPHTLWIGNGDDAFHAAPAPADGPLVDSGFVDRLFGVAVVAPGQLLRTLDGGAHFEPVDLGPEATYVVYPNTDGFVLDTTRGLMRLGPSGGPQPYAGDRGESVREVPLETVESVSDSVLSRDPYALATLFAHGAVLLEDGHLASVSQGHALLVASDGALTTLDMPGEQCEISAWGRKALLRCEVDDSAVALFTLTNQHTWSELHRHGAEMHVVPGADGVTLVTTGACDESATAARGETALCWYDGATWRTRILPARASVLSASGEFVLYEVLDASGDATGRDVRLARLGESTPGSPLQTDGDATVVAPHFIASGEIVGTVTLGARHAMAVGAPEHRLAVRALPEHAVTAEFVDASRGIATGHALDEVWVTTDGAATWTRLELPVDGDASSVPLVHRAPLDELPVPPIVCTNAACAVGRRLIWQAPGVFAAPTARLVAAHHAASLEAALDEPPSARDEGFRPGAGRCEPADNHRAVENDAYAGRLFGADGWIDPRRTGSNAAQGGQYALRWGGRDERGAFESSARTSVLPPIATASAPATTQISTGDDGELFPRLLTRTLAVLERCVGAPPANVCDLVIAPRGRIARIVASETLLPFAHGPVRVRSAMATMDGGALLLVGPTVAARTDTPQLDVLLRLDARGDVTARRGFAWSHARTVRMLAQSPRGAGLVVATSTAPRQLTWYGLDAGDDGRAIGTLPPDALGLCSDHPGPSTAISFIADQREYAPVVTIGYGRFHLEAPASVRALYELASDRAPCLRGVSFWSFNPVEERALFVLLGGVPRLRAAAGVMQAAAIDRAHTASISCTW